MAILLHCGHGASSPIPSFVRKAFVDMRVPASARRSVIFIGEMLDGRFVPRATGFFVYTGDTQGEDDHLAYLVTAEHVISGMAHRQKEIFARFNLQDGTTRIESLQNAKWWYHPTEPENTDVALTPVTFDWNIIDHESVPLLNWDPYKENTVLQYSKPDIGLGTETFAVGLFRSHYGAQRNIPVIRTGNIAAMVEEPIKTRHGSGFVEGYLVEMRSIAGLSGSPVFAARPDMFFTDYKLDFNRLRPQFEQINWFGFILLGLVHGHFDVRNPMEDMAFDDADGNRPESVNTGMGIVIPAIRIQETLYQTELTKERRKILEERKRTSATPD